MCIRDRMYNEYYSRLKEINFIIVNRDAYKHLLQYKKTIELILSLSIFYKRVIANMDAATKFAGTVFSNSSAIAIKIGSYNLTGSEKNRIIAVVMNYNSLTQKYSLTNDLLATSETKDLIKKIKDLKWQLDNNEINNKDDNDNIE